MPRTKPGGLTMALAEPDGDTAASPSARPAIDPLHNAPPGSSHSTESSNSSALAVPPSPASPKHQSRSFFSGYRNTRMGKPRGPDFPPDRLVPNVSNNTLAPPGAHLPPRSMSPSPSQAGSYSHSNLLDNLSISDRSGLNSSATSELEHDPEWSEGLPHIDQDIMNQRRPSAPKHAFHQFMSRSKSTKTDMHQRQIPSRPTTGRRQLEPVLAEELYPDPPLTAPLDHDRTYREFLVGSSTRNRSADRTTLGSKEGSESNYNLGTSWESGGMLSSHKGNSSKIAPSRSTKPKTGGLFRFMRTGSGNDETSEAALQAQMTYEDQYKFQNIILPIGVQTRHTRICPNIGDARDKTEYWLPAILYRCIDFLNQKAGAEEGLYRVPGSIREVKQWQIRFDKEGDVNLLQQTNLYDVNVVGSMLKAYLRDLPSPLLSKEVQDRVVKECAGASETPQMLKNELSSLPPTNYYALFAISCHLASLVANSDINKMTFQNLCICFQPCTRIDPFCFFYLVCDWANCWQGCRTEKEYFENELRMQPDYSARESQPIHMLPMQPPLPGGLGQSMTTSVVHDDSIPSGSSKIHQASHSPDSGVDQSIPISAIYDNQGHSEDNHHEAMEQAAPPSLGQPGFSSIKSKDDRSVLLHQFEADDDHEGDASAVPTNPSYRGTPPTLSPVQPLSPFRMPPTTRYSSIP